MFRHRRYASFGLLIANYDIADKLRFSDQKIAIAVAVKVGCLVLIPVRFPPYQASLYFRRIPRFPRRMLSTITQPGSASLVVYISSFWV